MKRKIEYKNRYGDVITFEYKAPNKVIMTGGEYFRWGYPNDYTEAYAKYCNSVDLSMEKIMSLQEFKEQVHMDRYDGPIGWKNPLEPYRYLVVSDTSKIDMADPSGGPYLHSGHDMNDFGFGRKKPMIIDQFLFNEDGTKTILLK
jgi:hypothetical protein